MSEKNQTKSKSTRVGRGGPRKGAGRKPGSATKRTREVADQAAEEGVTPLEFMLDVMRNEPPANLEPGDVIKAQTLRFEAAKAAAPYIHPRLAAVEVTGKDGKDLMQAGGVLVVPGMAMSAQAWSDAVRGTTPAPPGFEPPRGS